MKRILIILAFAALSINAQAQQKIGYINSLELLAAMPGIKKADAQIKSLAENYENQLKAMQAEGEKKIKEFQASEKTMNEAMREVKITEIQDLERRIQTLNETATQKVSDKRETLYAPELKRANEAIQAVGKAKGYSFILDASTNVLVYAAETDNLLNAVKSHLGIQ